MKKKITFNGTPEDKNIELYVLAIFMPEKKLTTELCSELLEQFKRLYENDITVNTGSNFSGFKRSYNTFVKEDKVLLQMNYTILPRDFGVSIDSWSNYNYDFAYAKRDAEVKRGQVCL